MTGKGFYDAVLNRHSVRKYSATPIPEDVLHRIMEAVRLSPSGGNGQGWGFVLVVDPTLRQGLAKAAGDQQWVAEAPVIAALCAKPELPVGEGDDFGREVNVLRWGLPAVGMMEAMEDKDLLALLMGNNGPMIPGTHLTLAAAAEGLGTCWIGYLDIEETSRLLGMPEDWKCYFLIPMGYPADPIIPGGHDRKPMESMVFLDKWSEPWPMAKEPSPLPGSKVVLASDTLSAISLADRKPEMYTPHEAAFWDHPHISKQMLIAHLNPDWDAASVNHMEIDARVEWLTRQLELEPGMTVLDCGCGPGLYCTRFAEKGLSVTGIDLSRNSLEYAEEAARRDGHGIRYIRQDYVTMEWESEFDAALIIYMDFGVLSDGDRGKFLKKVHKALKPGGRFALDVESWNTKIPEDGASHWSVAPEGGFWRPGPYIELRRDYAYTEHGVHVEQIHIMESGGGVSTYRIWNKAYTIQGIREELEDAGFQVEGLWESLSGKELGDDSPVIAVICRKPLT